MSPVTSITSTADLNHKDSSPTTGRGKAQAPSVPISGMDSTAAPPQLLRPRKETLLAQWDNFFSDPLLSLSTLKSHAIEGQIDSLRSLHWRYFFSLLPSPAPLSFSTRAPYSLLLARSRSEYAELSARYLRSPDGGLVNDGDGDSLGNASNGNEKASRLPDVLGLSGLGVQVNNPLSLDSENPWQSWFADLELRKTIRQDVQRT